MRDVPRKSPAAPVPLEYEPGQILRPRWRTREVLGSLGAGALCTTLGVGVLLPVVADGFHRVSEFAGVCTLGLYFVLAGAFFIIKGVVTMRT